MVITSYDFAEVKLVQKTENPIEILRLATNITMKKSFEDTKEDISGRIKRLLKMNHTSLLNILHIHFY